MRVLDEWLLTPQRAAVHLPTATAVLADLHLGYDEARRRRGEAIPSQGLGGLGDTLATLRAVHGAKRLVIAGDLCEDASGLALLPDLVALVGQQGLELTAVVPGNHDRGLARHAATLPLAPEGVQLGGWLVLHGDGPLPAGRRVMGHFHPRLRWGPRVSASCYLVGPDQLVLPAFSRDAAGEDVLRSRRWVGHRCVAIADDALLDFGPIDRLAEQRGRRGV